MHHTVDPDPAVALGVQLVEEVDELALAGAHHRGEDLELRPSSMASTWSTICCGVWRAMRSPQTGQWGAGPGVQKTQIVVHLGDGADGRAGLRLVDFWSIDTAGERPSMKSTSGLSI